MNGHTPLVSIIITCYNYGRFLSEAIASVRAQTYSNIELIVVDDGSNDPDTVKPLDELASDSSLTLIRNSPNQGPATAKNIGIAASKGEFFALLDADDKIAPEFVKATVAEMNDPKVGVVYTDQQLFGNENRKIAMHDFSVELLLTKNHISSCSLVRRRAYDQVKEFNGVGVNPNMVYGYEDWDLWISVAECDWKFTCVHQPLFEYRKHGTSVSTRAERNHKYLVNQLIQNHTKLYGQYPAARRQLLGEGVIKRILRKIVSLGPVSAALGRTYPYNRLAGLLRAQSRKYVLAAEVNTPIDIVMLTLNRKAETMRTIKSIYRETKVPFRLILLDMNSTDGTSQYIDELAQKHRNIVVKHYPENLGVSGGRAAALEFIQSDYVTYIDNDMVIMPGYFEHMLAAFMQRPDVAAVVPKVVLPNAAIQINLPKIREEGDCIYFYDQDYGKHYSDASTFESGQCDWIAMGVSMWKAEVLRTIPIDKDMLGSFEDNEYSYRVRSKGYRFFNCPQSITLHIRSEFAPGAMEDKVYTAGRWNLEKTRAATVRFYQKHEKILIVGTNADQFSMSLGFNDAEEYKAFLKSTASATDK